MWPADIRTSKPTRCGARSPLFIASRPSRWFWAAAPAKSCGWPSMPSWDRSRSSSPPCRRSSRSADAAERAGAKVVGVPLSRDYSHDLNAMLARIDADHGAGLHLQSEQSDGQPDARGRSSRRSFAGFRRRCVVLIDEAYHHYVGKSSDYASFIDAIDPESERDPSRVIVTRSFSKIYGLAGLRVGYAVAAGQTARVLASQQCRTA